MGDDRMEIPRDRRRATGDGQKQNTRPTLAVYRRPFRGISFRSWPVAAVLGIALALSGCGNIEPWVKPYERQQLADPIMAFDANPVSKAYMDHVFEAREGARGGLGSAGGGCGCN